MGNKIFLKRGHKVNLNKAGTELAEPKYVVDEEALYIGTGTENIKIGSKIPEGESFESLNNKINTHSAQLQQKVDKVSGKQLSTEDYTTTEKNKLHNIESEAQVNKIETILVNGTIVPIVNKNVNIVLEREKTKLSEFIDDLSDGKTPTHNHNSLYYKKTEINVELNKKVDKIEGKQLSTEDYTTTEKNKLSEIESKAQVNKIEKVSVNNSALPISDKNVNITVPTKLTDLVDDLGTECSSHYHDGRYYKKEQIDLELDKKVDKSKIASSFQSVPDNEHVTSEKLVKDNLDSKIDKTSISKEFATPLSDEEVPSEKLVKESLDTKFDKEDIVTEFSAELTTVKVPCEKLVKDNLDLKVNITDIKNDYISDDSNKPSSAHLTHDLNNRLLAVESRGRYLSDWDCKTGLPTTPAPTNPYVYKTGDYYIISTVANTELGEVNYKPSGSEYREGVPSTVPEDNTVHINDTYNYDGTIWKLRAAADKEITFANISGSPYDNTSLGAELDKKFDEENIIKEEFPESPTTDTVPSVYLTKKELDKKFDKTNIVKDSFSITPSDDKVPSEKLVKNSIVNNFSDNPSEVKVPSEKLVKNSLDLVDTHISSKNNPHEVNKEQVGLSKVDNKSEEEIKEDFTGSIENGNTGFVLGKDTYNKLEEKFDKTSLKTSLSAEPSDSNALSEKFIDNTYAKKSDVLQSNWSQTDDTKGDFIKNKPDVYTKSEVDSKLDNKVTVVPGKDLSTNDFTDAYKSQLDNLDNIYAKVDDLNAHTTDDTIHVTSEEKTKISLIDKALFKRVATSNTTINIKPREQYEISGTPTSLDVTFSTPDVDYISEYRIIFTTDSSASFTFTPHLPTGYTLEGLPTFEKGKTYELDFNAQMGKLKCVDCGSSGGGGGGTDKTKLSEFTDDLGSSPVHTHSQYALDSDLTTHTSDTTSHITSTERNTWNGKQDLGKLTIGSTEYTLRVSNVDEGAEGYITFVVEE